MLLGITGKDFVIVAASKAAMRGPTILKATDDKTRQLNKHTILAFSGEAGDTGEHRRRDGVGRATFGPSADTYKSNSPSTSKQMLSSTR